MPRPKEETIGRLVDHSGNLVELKNMLQLRTPYELGFFSNQPQPRQALVVATQFLIDNLNIQVNMLRAKEDY